MSGSNSAAEPGTEAEIRIMIVDDHPIVREGLALFLNQQERLHAACEAADAEAALAAMARCYPALVIVDISLGSDSGLNLIKTLRQRHPAVKLLALSMHEEALFAERALAAGADGYLMKQEGTQNILTAVERILAGERYLSASLRERLERRPQAPTAPAVDGLAGLSAREFEVLHLIGLGFGTRQIAAKLHRSIKTIEAHRANLKTKLRLDSGRDLDRFAAQWLEGTRAAGPKTTSQK